MKKLFLLSALVCFLALSFNFVLADDPPKCTPKCECIYAETEPEHAGCGFPECGGVVIEYWYDTRCGTGFCYEVENESNGPWEDARPECNWGWSCHPGCLDLPTPDYYWADPGETIKQKDYPIASQYPYDETPNERVYLPVKLGWDHIRGWMHPTGPKSYRIQIDGTTRDYPPPYSYPPADPSDPDPPGGPGPSPPAEGFLTWPVDNIFNVSDYYAQDRRAASFPYLTDYHTGIDFFGGNVPIYAAGNGEVVRVNRSLQAGMGRWVLIKHPGITSTDGRTVLTRYLHLKSIDPNLNEGDMVTAGQQIGIMGGTGSSENSYAIHLHWDVCFGSCRYSNWPNEFDDPLNYITRDQRWADFIEARRSHHNHGRENYYWPGTVPIYISNKDTDPFDLYNTPPPTTSLNSSSSSCSLVTNDSLPSNENNTSFLSELSSSFVLTSNSLEITLEECLRTNRFIADKCLLRSDYNHNWRVQGCCDTECNSCHPTCWSEYDFITDEAPEPIEPYDPSWAGDYGMAGGHHNPLGFQDANSKWCDPENEDDYKGYLLLAFKEINGNMVCHPDRLRPDGVCRPILVRDDNPVPIHRGPPPTEIINIREDLFNEIGEIFAWRVAACEDHKMEDCSDYSQKWRLIVGDTIKNPHDFQPANDPEGETPIGIYPDATFRWNWPFGAHSFWFQLAVDNENQDVIIEELLTTNSFTVPAATLGIENRFIWRVKSCYDEDGENCLEEWTENIHFTTTGRPPNLEETAVPPDGSEEVTIPLTIEWESVPGAQSYIFRIDGEERRVSSEKIHLNYPQLKTGTEYSWTVKTCADPGGSAFCGGFWSPEVKFTTLVLQPPTNPSPEDNSTLFTDTRSINASWSKARGANYYEYEISYPGGETESDIISGTSFYVNLFDLGTYNWRVRSCLDSNCEDSSAFSNWSFTYEEIEADGVGLVPCGRAYDSPSTPWNEREPCQLKHLFILFKILTDFVLWNLFPVALVLMVLTTGALFSFASPLGPSVLARVKLLWKGVGIGFVVLFFGWIILTIGLSMIGYDAGIYGPWWQINF